MDPWMLARLGLMRILQELRLWNVLSSSCVTSDGRVRIVAVVVRLTQLYGMAVCWLEQQKNGSFHISQCTALDGLITCL